MNTYSDDVIGKDSAASYKQHLVYEVATSLADSKHIAEDYNNAYRYQHRAQVSIVGHSTLRPYDPIYLDGLPNGMSGYWTVISVKHVFGGAPANYMLSLEVGTDTLGDVDAQAKYRSDTRDVQSDLSGQSLNVSNTSLSDYTISPNSSSLDETTTQHLTAKIKDSSVSIPKVPGITTYKDYTPNLSNIKNTVKWAAKSTGKVIK